MSTMCLVIQSFLFLWFQWFLGCTLKGFASFEIIALFPENSVSIFAYLFLEFYILKNLSFYYFLLSFVANYKRREKIFSLESCVIFQSCGHCIPLPLSFLSFLENLSIFYFSLYYVFNLSLFLRETRDLL